MDKDNFSSFKPSSIDNYLLPVRRWMPRIFSQAPVKCRSFTNYEPTNKRPAHPIWAHVIFLVI